MQSIKKYVAECIGTFVLVFFACGTAVVSGCVNGEATGYIATALAVLETGAIPVKACKRSRPTESSSSVSLWDIISPFESMTSGSAARTASMSSRLFLPNSLSCRSETITMRTGAVTLSVLQV